MKRSLLVITLILLTASLTLTSSATGTLLSDGADILTPDEEEQLLPVLEKYSTDAEADIAIVTVSLYNGHDIEAYTEKFCDNGFMSNGIVLLVSMGTREYCPTKCGSTEKAIDDTGLDYIKESISPYLSNGDYYVAFSIFAEMSRNAIVEYNRSGDSFGNGDFKPTVDVMQDGTVIITEGSRPISHYVTCLVIGLVLAFVAMLIMQSGMKTVKSQNFAGNYIVSGSLKMRVSSDRFLYRTVSKTPKPKSNNSSGSFRGGGSGRSSSGRF